MATGIRNFEAKAARVVEYLAAHPGAGSRQLGYGAKLNTPGPMGGDGRSEALGVCAVLERQGQVVREVRGDNYYWHVAAVVTV